MLISEVSEKYHISPDTLRYCEKIGLRPPVRRSKSGLRDYDENDLVWIDFIKCMPCRQPQSNRLRHRR